MIINKSARLWGMVGIVLAGMPLAIQAQQDKPQPNARQNQADKANSDQAPNPDRNANQDRNTDQDRNANRNADQNGIPNGQMTAYLGAYFEDMHPAFGRHVPGMSDNNGQGVLIMNVIPDSPAAKAGLQEHDILLTYDDQKLFTAEQLFHLVRTDKPGKQVKLGVLDQGKRKDLNVTLGQRQQQMTPQTPGRFGFMHPDANWPWVHQNVGQFDYHPDLYADYPSEEELWRQFDSLSLKKMQGDQFQAVIKHTDKQGKMRTHQYTGTREEIHNKIKQDKDLTQMEREHLLRSLDLGDDLDWEGLDQGQPVPGNPNSEHPDQDNANPKNADQNNSTKEKADAGNTNPQS